MIAPLAACVLNDNGSTFSGSNVGRSITMEGFSNLPDEEITIQVLASANAAPTSNANWVTLATPHTSSNPTNHQGDNLYYWFANVVPVPTFLKQRRWRPGGMARFRVLRSTGQTLTTFDDTGCWQQAFGDGKSYAQIGSECESHANPILTFVDKDPVSASVVDYLSFKATPGEGDDYALQIAAPNTLNQFKATRGFPAGEVEARYYNIGDLGIGREMHCRENPGGSPSVACYVTNYGDPTDGLADKFTALDDAINGHAPFATVAMDYFPGTSQEVRFYTYNGAGNLIFDAALDSEGAKSTPGLCIACHGGTYNSVTNSITGAKFLPFDLNAFGFKPSGSYSRANQEEEFRQLNQIVKATNPGSSITNLINGWYGGALGAQTPGTTQDSDWVPPGFSSEPIVYQKAVAPFCRTCHIASDAYPMDTFAQLSAMAPLNAVCSTKYMPHSEVTRKSFWASSGRAHLAGALGWATHCN